MRLQNDYSYMTDATESFQSDADEDSRSVDVTINILALTHGILMETSKNEEKKINEGFKSLQGDQTVRAVVSGFKGTSAQLSHLTSLPLKEINQNLNSKPRLYEFMALWPSNLEDASKEPTMTFNRRIKRSRNANSDEEYTYRNEKLTLAISLMKGYEIITLGQVSIPFVFSKRTTHVQLPIRTTLTHVENAAAELKGIKLQRENRWKRKMKKNRVVKPLAFSDDVGRAYRFHEDSLLSVLVRTKLTFDKRVVQNRIPRKELITRGITPLGSKLTSDKPRYKNILSPQVEESKKSLQRDKVTNDIIDGGKPREEKTRIQTENKKNDKQEVDDGFSAGESSDEDFASDLIADAFVCIDQNKKPSIDQDQNETNKKSSNGFNEAYNALKDIKPNRVSCEPGVLKYLTYSETSHLSNLSSPTMNSCAFPKENSASPAVYIKKYDQLDDNLFSTVTVDSKSTDNGDGSFEVVDNFGFPGTSVSYLAKNDSISASSWTFASWNV